MRPLPILIQNRPLTTTTLASLAMLAVPASAQVLEVRPVTPATVSTSIEALRAAQEGFETFRRRNAPVFSVRVGPDRCDERVGRFCYWYEEGGPEPPDEPGRVTEARTRLIVQLDSVGVLFPNDRWISGQRVRYLAEAGRDVEAVRAANACTVRDWWCDALRGFAHHVAGSYEEADSAFERALRLMTPAERCNWRDLKLLLPDDQLRGYRERDCAGRLEMERKIWWLARPRLAGRGNDARTEYYARLMMAYFVEDAPSAYSMGFDFDERELTLRYGWPIAWTRAPGPVPIGMEPSLVGHERVPAHPFLPARAVLENPASSDSAAWRSKGIPPVRSRYAPPYARRLLPLEHQSALFRRGDSALVLVAWSVGRDTALRSAAASGELTAALVLTRGQEEDAVIVRSTAPRSTGTFSAKSPWGSMLLSVEVAGASSKTLARARYGVRRSDAPQAVIQVSDILLYEPVDSMPARAEDALSRMRTSERIPEGSRVGLFWEAYNTEGAFGGLDVNITVAPVDSARGSWVTRGLRALRRVREAQPVSVGIRDAVVRGAAVTSRAIEVDLSGLGPGRYQLQLELSAGPGNVVRVERSITIVSRES
ncbi:MAG: hypothetical protein HUU26_02140 [Gemmatimonadaceae bacterium]|nr:hypothetical protein [Gemmatimonadaceae bacterium]